MTDSEQDRHIRLGREVIRTEARALNEVASALGKDFVAAVELIASSNGRVCVVGVGKSAHICSKVASMFSSTGMPAFFLRATEAMHGELGPLRKGDVVVTVSHSGESPEIVALLPAFEKFELPLITITDHRNSTIGRASQVVIESGSTAQDDPISLAPTASAAAALALGDALALAVAQHNGFTPADFALYRPGGELGQLIESVYSEARNE